MSLIQTYSIQDRTFYDASSNDNVSKYDTSHIGYGSFSYDSTKSAYKLQKSSGNGAISVIIDDLSVSNKVKVECDIMIGQINTNTQPALRIANGDVSGAIVLFAYRSSTSFNLNKYTGYNSISESNISTDSTISLSADNWYHCELSVDNGVWTAKLYNGDSLLSTLTGTDSTILSSTGNQIIISFGHDYSANAWFKNLMVQEL